MRMQNISHLAVLWGRLQPPCQIVPFFCLSCFCSLLLFQCLFLIFTLCGTHLCSYLSSPAHSASISVISSPCHYLVRQYNTLFNLDQSHSSLGFLNLLLTAGLPLSYPSHILLLLCVHCCLLPVLLLFHAQLFMSLARSWPSMSWSDITDSVLSMRNEDNATTYYFSVHAHCVQPGQMDTRTCRWTQGWTHFRWTIICGACSRALQIIYNSCVLHVWVTIYKLKWCNIIFPHFHFSLLANLLPVIWWSYTIALRNMASIDTSYEWIQCTSWAHFVIHHHLASGYIVNS